MIKVFVTGPPGIGKTTCVIKLYETLTIYNYRVGGFVSEEIRKNGYRVGFKVRDLSSGSETLLASIYEKTMHRIGKYYVKLEDFNNFLESLEKFDEYDLIIIDEIGPMEMLSTKFKSLVTDILRSEIPAVFTVHINISNKLRNLFSTDKPNILFKLTKENRGAMPYIIWREIQRYIRK